MKLRKMKSILASLLFIVICSLSLAQESNAAIGYGGPLEIDFYMLYPNGAYFNDATVQVDIMEEYNYPTVNQTYLAKDVQLIKGNGRYYYFYGNYNIGWKFNYPGTNIPAHHYAFYTNLRILPKKYVKSIKLGAVKTFRVQGQEYSPFRPPWEMLIKTHDEDYPIQNSNDKFTVLADGTHVWKEENFLTGDYMRPTVEFASYQMGQGGSVGVYRTSSINKSGSPISLIVDAYTVKENFVDTTDTPITPPAGFSNGRATYATAEQFNHTMNKVPDKYTAGGKVYLLKGSYNGPTKPSTLNTSNPPTFTIDYTDSSIPNFDDEGELKVVYAIGVKLTEKYVDESGAQIDASWDLATPQDIEDGTSFTLPHSIGDTKIDSGGKTWEYVGWKYDTDPAGTQRTTATTNSISGDTTIEYIFKQTDTTAALTLSPNPQIISNNGNVSWTSRLENTGNAPLSDLKIKATSTWATGLTHPIQVTITPAGSSPVNVTIGPGDWLSGVNLTGVTIPNGGPNNYADITFTTTATGAINQVLPAEIEVDGNIPTPVIAENFVRVDDPDEPNLVPTGTAGLINIPHFHFGEVEVKPYAQTKGLDASYYEAGYNPYIRFMDEESTGIYSLAVRLSPFTNGSKSLPASTYIRLKNGVSKEVQNYNKHNESLSAGTSIGPMTLPADNTTSFLYFGNTQGVYQIDYAFNDVELNLMAHSGISGTAYTATLDWTLTTAP